MKKSIINILLIISTTNSATSASGKQLSFGGFSWDAIAANKKQSLGRFAKIDVNALNYYNQLLTQDGFDMSKALEGTEKQFGKLSEATKTYIKNAGGAQVETGKLSKSFATLGLKGIAAQAGMMALNAALNVGISLAVAAVVNGITNLITAQDRAIEKAQELQSGWKESAQTLSETKSTVEGLKGEYETLADGVDSLGNNVSLTADEYARYNEIANQIANMFPEMVRGYTAEGNAIIKNAGNVDALTAAYERLAEVQRSTVISEANDVIKGIQNQALGGMGVTERADSMLNQYLSLQAYLDAFGKGDEKQMRRLAISEGKDSVSGLTKSSSALQEALQTLGLDGYGADIHATLSQHVPQLQALMRSLGAQLSSVASGYYPIIEALLGGDGRYTYLEDETKALINSVVYGLDSWKFLDFENTGTLGVYLFDSIVAPFQDDSLTKTISDALDVQELVNDSATSFVYLENAYGKVAKEIEGMAPEVQDAILSMFDLGEGEALINRLVGKGFKEEFLKTLTLKELSIAVELEPEIGMSEMELKKQIADIQSKIPQTSASLKSSFEATGKSQTALNEAVAEIESLGAIGIDTYNKLIEANKEFAYALDDSTGYLTLNYEAAQKVLDAEYEMQKQEIALAKAKNIQNYEDNSKQLEELAKQLGSVNKESEDYNILLEQQKEIQAKQTGILSEIKNLELLASSIEYATSAYKRWLDAQEAPEDSDIFDSLKSAAEQIEEGIKTGKTGTRKYASAAEMLFGPNWQEANKEDITSWLEGVNEYFTGDAEGMRKGVDKLVEAGIMSEKNGQYFSIAGHGIEEYAKALGMGEEATRYFLAALKDYGWNIDIPGMGEGTERILEYEKLLDNAAQKQSDYQKLLSQFDTATATEEDLKKLEEYRKAWKEAQAEADNYAAVHIDQPKTEIELLTEDLAALKDAYAELEKLVITGIVGDDVVQAFATIKSGLDALGNTPKDGYNLKITSNEEADKAKETAESIKAFLGELEKAKEDGTISNEIYLAIVGTAEAQLAAIEASLDHLTDYEFEIKTKVITEEDYKNAYDKYHQPRQITEEFLSNVVAPEDGMVIEVEANTQEAENSVDKLKDDVGQGATLPVNIKYNSSGRPAGANGVFQKIFGFAKGTSNAPDGPALVGEGVKNGKYQPEIVVKNKTGEYFVTDQPQLVDLDKGDQVINGEQTKKILGGKTPKGGKAFASGTLGTWVGGVLASLGVTASGSFSNTSSNKSSNKNAGNKTVDPKDLVDWIPTLLNNLKKFTENLVKQAEKAIGYVAKNMQLDKALSNIELETSKNQAAYERYMKQANTVELSEDIKKLVQEGDIDIAAYDDKTRELINNYQKWYDLAQGCLETVEDLKEQQIDLSKQKLENIVTYYENRIERLEAQATKGQDKIDLKSATGKEILKSDYDTIIKATQDKIGELTEQRQVLNDEFEKLVAGGIIERDSEAWHEYTAQLEELDSQIIQTEIDLNGFKDAVANLPLTNLQYALTALQETQKAMENLMSLHDAQKAPNRDVDYEELIRNSIKQINNMEEQNVLLREQLEGLDVLSEKYQEIKSQIAKNEEEIMNAKIAQEEWNDAILDLKISKLEEEREELEKTNDAYQRQKELQEALDDLEKAKRQKTVRVFRENQGFVYESDQDAIQQAQDRVNEVRHQETLDKIDEAIDALEDQKKDDNVYDYEGNLIKPYANGGIDSVGGLNLLHGSPSHVETIFNAEDGRKLFELIHGTDNLSHEVAKNFDTANLLRQIETVGKSNVNTFSIGDIVIQKADSAEGLAQDIIRYLPNALLTEMYKN